MDLLRRVNPVLQSAMRLFAVLLALAALLAFAVPASAASAVLPDQKQGKYERWSYPSQVTYGPLEDGQGNTGEGPAAGAFLTLPFMGPHYITSIFDHCGPNYTTHTDICRYDGTVASAKVGGPDPTFSAGYAQTPGWHDYLYYSGHDGYDYGLNYEPVAAAAPGRVMLANWLVPGCHTCLSGMTVEIDHGNGLLTLYGHLSRILVTKGQYVSRGQVIAISGMTGTATGPHLHFGVYHIDGAGPVDPYGWAGRGSDPYAKDEGDLWLTGSPRFANVAMPHVTLTATLRADDPRSIDVSWSSPGAGAAYTIYYVTQDGTMREWGTPAGSGTAVFAGGWSQKYWFWASVRTSLGWTDAAGSQVVQVPALVHGQQE